MSIWLFIRMQQNKKLDGSFYRYYMYLQQSCELSLFNKQENIQIFVHWGNKLQKALLLQQ